MTGDGQPDRGEQLPLFAPGIRSTSGGGTALVSLFALEYIAVGTAMPSVARDLDGLDQYALAFGATIATSIIGMTLGGWWSDRSGPRPVILVGCLAFCAGLVLAGLAPTMEVFVTGRALQGVGSGLSVVAIYVVIAQLVAEVMRPKMFSLLAAAWVVPGLIGPVLTGIVVEQAGWRWVFLGVAPLVLVGLAVFAPALRRTHPADDAPYLQRATVLWAVVAAGGVLLLNLGGEQVSIREALVGAPVVALLALAAMRLLPAGTVRLWRGLPSVVAARGALGASFIAAEAYLPLLLQELHGYGPAWAGAVLAVGSVTWALGSWWQGRLADHVDRYRLLLRGCLVVLGGAAVLTAAVWAGWPGWTVVLLWGLTLTGVGLAYPTTSLLTLRLSPPSQVGMNSSALQVSEALASAAVLAVVGGLFAALFTERPVAAFTVTVLGSVVVAAIASLAASRARPLPF